MSIAESVARLQDEIVAACATAGRKPDEVTLVAVSKTFPSSAIQEAHAAGLRHFAENRVQELTGKAAELSDLGLTWHMVGSLQTNKVRALLPHLGLLHSLDRRNLAEAIAQQVESCAEGPGQVPVQVPVQALVQVNTTGEPSKSGVSPEGVATLVDQIRTFPVIQLRGLMTIGPLGGSESEIRRAFALLRTLREETGRRHPDLPLDIVSMGMSDDFPLAIREGATLIRIGSRIFGERHHPQKG